MNGDEQQAAARTWNRPLIYLFVFFSGFALLATEIIGPRLFSSLFGDTTVTWAIIISVTLLGISLGYYLGGRIAWPNLRRTMFVVLLVNAVWLLAISWIVWQLPAQLGAGGYQAVLITAAAAFVLPAMLFSTASPVAISILTRGRPVEEAPRIVGNVLAVGTIGSVSGALAAAFYLIPWVGLSLSLQLFAVGLALFALYFAPRRLALATLPLAAASLLVPQPSFQWSAGVQGTRLLAQQEGYYQTIRVYSDEQTFVRMHLGPTYESEMSLLTGEPNFGYARMMVELAGDVAGKQVLVIGGAGHSQARALEARGARVTEVEIDPFVIALSDRYFGPIEGQVVAQDGRAFVAQAQPGRYDLMLIDAYNGPASVPPQLTTVEFFEAAARALKPDGRLLYNFIGSPSGPRSASFQALAATISAVFADTRASATQGQGLQNIIFMASQMEMADSNFAQAPTDGVLLTDNRNPIEIFLEEARAGISYFRR